MKKLLFSWKRGGLRWLREPRVIWRIETEEMQTTIEVRYWIPFVVFLVTFFWYLADPAPVAMMSTVTLGCMILSSFLWSRSQARGVRGQRRLQFAAMQVGDELEEQISLKNNTLLPVIWTEYLDRSNIPGYTVSSARAADPNSQMEWRAHTICTRRGVFSLGPWELHIGEPFGMLIVRQVYLQHQEILVYPPLALLPEHILPHRGAIGDHRPLNQPLRAETIATYAVRGYVPGDPLRHIHWRTTARRIDPFVKVFSPEAASNIWLVPDFDAAVQVGTGDNASEETMVTVVASIAAALLQQNLAVGMFASGDKDTVVLPRAGQHHLWAILQSLAPLHAANHSLEDVLGRARSLVSGKDLLILVTPSLCPDWVGALRQISRSRGSSGRAEVVLLDPASFVTQDQACSAESAVHPQAEAFITLLLEQGISANLLRREDVHLISGFYGEVSRWEFAVSGTGRAVARKAPRTAKSNGQQNFNSGEIAASKVLE